MRRQAQRVALALEAAVLLVLAQVAVKLLSGPRTTRLLGSPQPAAPLVRSARLDPVAWRMGHMVSRVARLLPSHPVCLPQALATRAMLRRRGFAARSHLGVTGTQPLEAHAWVSVDGFVVVGGPVAHVTEIAAFV